MTVEAKQTARTHDDVLEEISDAIDIPQSLYEEAISKYESIGDWLDRDESTLSQYQPAISPQGSFLLGTVIRPLSNKEEYDVDLICLLEATKKDFTQKSLKEAVGVEIHSYARATDMSKRPKERRRCWTLHYADGAQFHLDVLPALPDAQSYQLVLLERGHDGLAGHHSLSGEAIAITDRTSPQYALLTDDWPQSNPLGFAAWFRSRMTTQLRERKRAFLEGLSITASVDEIPDYKVRTPLQRAIQLLKRHRDSMFAGDPEYRPISMIITTLAALSYNEEPSIAGALQSILMGMDQHIEHRGGEAWVPNPVNPEENFADKWAEEPKRREHFYDWLEQARHDFALYLRGSAYDAFPDTLKAGLGVELVDSVLKTILPVAASGIASPAIANPAPRVDEEQRAEAAIHTLQRTGTQSKPWAS
jgi:Cyclic GMP-AMP synthase DncV-like, nucleotidyltransferase domain